MPEFPALPLFTDSYLQDCWHLSDAEHGRYLLLLMLIWQTPNHRIPNSPDWIARKLRRTVESYHVDIFPLIQEYCISDGNWISQKRLTKEALYIRKRSKSQSERSKLRWNKDKDVCINDAGPHTSGNAPTPTPTLKKEEKNNLKVIPKEKRGSRISDDFDPDGSCHVLADELLLSHKQCQDALANFIDYWKGVSGAKGTKLDWQATFRNQLRHVAKNSKGTQNERRKTNSESGEIARAAIKRKLAEVENEINPFGSIDGQSFEINPNVSRLFKS